MEIGIINRPMEEARPMFNPSIPTGKDKNPARRIQLRSAPAKTKHNIPNLKDFTTYCQIQYFRLTTLNRWFKHWVSLVGGTTSSSSTSSSSAPSYLFADSAPNAVLLHDDDDYSISEIATEDEHPNDMDDIRQQVSEIDELSEDKSWGEIQTRLPQIQPPRRDSELKHFLRSVMTSVMFHKLQACHASGKPFPNVQVPQECSPPFDELPDMVQMIIDLINVTNEEIDPSTFFYEMYLDYLEYRLDEEESEEFSPYFVLSEVARSERRAHERAQIRVIIESADYLFDCELRKAIGL